MYAHKSKLWIWLCQGSSSLSLLSELGGGGWEAEGSLGSWGCVATLLAVWTLAQELCSEGAAGNGPQQGSSWILTSTSAARGEEMCSCSWRRAELQGLSGDYWPLIFTAFQLLLGHALCLTVCAALEGWPIVGGIWHIIHPHVLEVSGSGQKNFSGVCSW